MKIEILDNLLLNHQPIYVNQMDSRHARQLEEEVVDSDSDSKEVVDSDSDSKEVVDSDSDSKETQLAACAEGRRECVSWSLGGLRRGLSSHVQEMVPTLLSV